MNIVLDSNILISATITEGLCNEILHYTIREHTLCLSEFILKETESKLIRKLKLSEHKVKKAIVLIRTESTIVFAPDLPKPVCRDPKDDYILSTARTATAEYIISGDNDLLVLKGYEGSMILSPREFYQMFIQS